MHVHKAFQVQDQTQVLQWIISGPCPKICSRKHDFVYIDMVNVVLDLNCMRLIKEHVGDNLL